MRLLKTTLIALGINFLALGTAQSQHTIPAGIIDELRQFTSAEIVLLSVEKANKKTASYDQARIDELDSRWRSEREDYQQPLIVDLMSRQASLYLLRQIAASKGLLLDFFITDLKGLNVAQAMVTSDYWQGDEDKFLKTVPLGPDGLLISEPEQDADTGAEMVQISFSIVMKGKVIGMACVDFNLTEAKRRGLL
ncbi:PDC sensor domain-containing protein [Polycladidibacter hongkongensis]|uniref:PDC sensor domain-containing protein n=1 Tax=Polycladidibacter hongkongensis TaxID=1647556 RepID=UPI00082F284C|nr:PDC sensor domain-containing protein [Pseudovibrio hongkongensis]